MCVVYRGGRVGGVGGGRGRDGWWEGWVVGVGGQAEDGLFLRLGH